MRKIVVAGWLAASSLVLAVPAAADSPVSLAPLAPGEVLLEVSGVGIARTPATSATLTATVAANGDTEAEARRSAMTALQRINAAARAAGIAAADIDAGAVQVSTDPYASYSEAMYENTVSDMNASDAMMNMTAVPGHTATASVSIRFRSPAAAAPLQRTLAALENVTAGEPAYQLDDDSAARRTARAEAVRKARVDAETYAATMNMRVARVLRVTERTGLDLLALGLTENSTILREVQGLERQMRDGQIGTYAIVGIDYALAPR